MKSTKNSSKELSMGSNPTCHMMLKFKFL